MSTPVTVASEAIRGEQVLVCRLRKRTTGAAAQSPTAGEIELENVSAAPVEIEGDFCPLQYLDLKITDSAGHLVSSFCYGELFSPVDPPFHLRLSPGQKYVAPVGLLGNVPQAKQVQGRYRVQAVYEYRNLRTVSEPFLLELSSPPGDGTTV